MRLGARDRRRGEAREGCTGARKRGSPHAGRQPRAGPGPSQTHLNTPSASAAKTKESSVKYLYLLYADESKMPAPGSPAFDAQNNAFNEYFAEIDGKGMFKAGDPVQPSKTSTTVRVRNGHTEATSGPFVKTGDQLVGFYVIEAKDLDEAVADEAECAVALVGAMEVRTMVEL